MQKRYIPNILSIIRMCLIPLFVYLFFCNYPNNVPFAVLIFFTAGATDVVDGWFARRYNCVSNVGKVLDPLADKLMQCTVLTCLYIKNLVPWWLPAFYITKELLILVGSLFVFRRQKVVVKSSFCGKLAVCVFYASIPVLIFLRNIYADAAWTVVVGIIMLGFALGALIRYFMTYIKAKNKK